MGLFRKTKKQENKGAATVDKIESQKNLKAEQQKGKTVSMNQLSPVKGDTSNEARAHRASSGVNQQVPVSKKKKWFEPEGELAVDVYETDQELVIQSTIAGLKPEDLDVSVENDMVTIKGVRRKPEEQGERNYFYQECYWGPFSRQVILQREVDNSRTQASMNQGILTIRIPKIHRERKMKIKIEKI